MKLQVLWVLPSERRFGSGDILTADELEAFGMNVTEMLAAGEAQILEAEKPEKRKAK